MVDGNDQPRGLVAETAEDLRAVAHPGDRVLLDPLVQELNELEVLLDANGAEGLTKLTEVAATVEGLLVSRHPPRLTREAGEALGRGAARLRRVERLLASPDRGVLAAGYRAGDG